MHFAMSSVTGKPYRGGGKQNAFHGQLLDTNKRRVWNFHNRQPFARAFTAAAAGPLLSERVWLFSKIRDRPQVAAGPYFIRLESEFGTPLEQAWIECLIEDKKCW